MLMAEMKEIVQFRNSRLSRTRPVSKAGWGGQNIIGANKNSTHASFRLAAMFSYCYCYCYCHCYCGRTQAGLIGREGYVWLRRLISTWERRLNLPVSVRLNEAGNTFKTCGPNWLAKIVFNVFCEHNPFLVAFKIVLKYSWYVQLAPGVDIIFLEFVAVFLDAFVLMFLL